MKKIDYRHGEDSVITSDTITKFLNRSTPPLTLRVREKKTMFCKGLGSSIRCSTPSGVMTC